MKNKTKEVIKNATLGAVVGYGVGYGLTWILNNAPEAIGFIKKEHRRSKAIKKAKVEVDKFETFTDSSKAFVVAAEHTKEMLRHKLFDEKIFVNTHVADDDIREFLLDLILKAQSCLEVIETETKEFRDAYINYFVEKDEADRKGFISKDAFDDGEDDEEFNDDGFFDDEEEQTEEPVEVQETTTEELDMIVNTEEK